MADERAGLRSGEAASGDRLSIDRKDIDVAYITCANGAGFPKFVKSFVTGDWAMSATTRSAEQGTELVGAGAFRCW
jgi:hypothetical protein